MVNSSGSIRQPLVFRQFGSNGAAGVPLAAPPGGVNKSDVVAAVYNIVTLASAAGSFETTISVAGQIQQTSASNLSANEYWFVIVPGS